MKVYLATKLFSFFDRLVSTYMYQSLIDTYGTTTDIYLPFRDSNMKVNQTGNVSKNIFLADVKQLKETDMFVCRLDGPAFDSGIGFELGYCAAKNAPVIAVTTDYYNTRIHERNFIISPIIQEMAYCLKYEYTAITGADYATELANNVFLFKESLHHSLQSIPINSRRVIPEFACFQKEFDVFLDFSGCRYKWNYHLLDILTRHLEKMGLSYVISQRYDREYSIDEDVNHLLSSHVYVICLDESEPDIDSCVLQGIAFARGKAIIGYETNPRRMFLPSKQEMGANLMVEQACDRIVEALEQIPDLVIQLKEKRYEGK